MSKCKPKDEEFIAEIRKTAKDFMESHCFLSYWRWNGMYDHYYSDLKVYYDAHPTWAKRDYVIEMTVPYDKWDRFYSQYLKDELRRAGATNIIGKVRHANARDYIDWAFDKKENRNGKN